jgi:hypothetical protein
LHCEFWIPRRNGVSIPWPIGQELSRGNPPAIHAGRRVIYHFGESGDYGKERIDRRSPIPYDARVRGTRNPDRTTSRATGKGNGRRN